MDLDRNGLEVLDTVECMALLKGERIGRLAVNLNALPCVLPVHYAVVGPEIVIRSEQGTKLSSAVRNAVVAFEIDHFDVEAGTGWSVLVRGRSRVMDESEEISLADQLPLSTWALERPHHYLAIETAIVSGRRLMPAMTP